MSWVEMATILLDVGRTTIGLAVNWLIQSTLLIAGGLAVGYLLRHRGSAVQSAVYRMTLVAVLVCPLATWGLSLLGVSGWSLQMPTAYSAAPAIVPSVITTTSEPAVLAETKFDSGPSNGIGAAAPTSPVAPNIPPLAGANTSGLDTTQSHISLEARTAPVPASEPVNVSLFNVHRFGLVAAMAAFLWLVAGLCLLCRLAVAWWHLHRLRRGGRAAELATVESCREIAAWLRVSPPEVLHSPYLPSPCLAGLRRPVVMLPESDLSLTVRDVLVHELAHLVRNDCFWNVARQVATAVLFFQPLAWILSRRLAATAEEVCDDYVVQYGGDRREYANRLVDIATMYVTPLAAAGVGIVSFRSMLAARVARILDTSRSLSTRIGHLLLAIVLVTGLAATFLVGLVGLQSAPVATDAKAAKGADDNGNSTKPPKTSSTPDDADVVTVRGQVVDPKGGVAKNTDVYVLRWYWNYGDRQPLAITKTDDQGRFTISYRKSQYFEDGGRPDQWREAVIVAFADGYGFGWVSYEDLPPGEGAKLKLVADDVPIEGRILDLEGKPVSDAQIEVDYLNDSKNGNLDEWLAAVRARQSIQSAVKYLKGGVPLFSTKRWQGIKTDTDGRFRLVGIGRERQLNIQVSGPTIVTSTLSVVTRDMQPIAQPAYSYPGAHDRVNYGAKFEYTAALSRPIEGIVRDSKTHDPIAGVEIWSSKFAGDNISGITTIKTKSDVKGHYHLEGMPKGAGNEIYVVPTDLPYFTCSLDVPDPPGIDPTPLDIELHRGKWVSGHVIDKVTRRGVPATMHYMVAPDNLLPEKLPEFKYGRHAMLVQDRYRTKADGSYRMVALPGRGVIGVSAVAPAYPSGQGLESIQGVEDRNSFQKYNGVFAPTKKSPTAVKEIQIPKDSDATVCDFELDSGRHITLRAVDHNGEPIKDLLAEGCRGVHDYHQKFAGPEFDVTALRDDEVRTVLVYQESRRLGTAMRLKPSDGAAGPIRVELEPCATVVGKLVDADGQPMRGVFLRIDVEGDGDYGRQLRSTATDADGRFRHDAFLPGLAYSIIAEGAKIEFAIVAKKLEVHPGETINLGTIDITSKKRPEMMRTAASSIDKRSANAAPSTKRAVSHSSAKKKPANSPKSKSAVVDSNAPSNPAPKPANDVEPLAHVHKNAAGQNDKKEAAQKISGSVVGADGKAVAGAKLYWITWRMRGEQPAPQLVATTGQNGGFDFVSPEVKQTASDTVNRMPNNHVVVVAPGHGMAYLSAHELRPRDPLSAIAEALRTGITGTTINLPADAPIKGRVVNVDGQPVANAHVSIRGITGSGTPNDPSSRRDLEARGRDKQEIEWRLRLNELTHQFWPAQLPSVAPTAKTDADGSFELRSIGKDRIAQLLIEGDNIASAIIDVRSSPGETLTLAAAPNFGTDPDTLYATGFTHVVAPSKPLEGRVVDLDTSKPLVGAVVRTCAVHGEKILSSRGREYLSARTDADGRYRITGLPTGDGNQLVAFIVGDEPYVPVGFKINTDVSAAIARQDFKLKRGVWAQGRAYDATTKAPLPGALEYYIIRNPDLERAVPGLRFAFIDEHYFTDADGRFRVPVLASRGILAFRYAPMNGMETTKYPRGAGAEKISGGVGQGEMVYFQTIPSFVMASNFQALTEVAPKKGQESLGVDFALSSGRQITVEAVDESGKPVVGLEVYGQHDYYGWEHIVNSKCQVKGLEPGKNRELYFLQRSRNLVGSASVSTDTKDGLIVKLSPGGGIRGRLVNDEGQPITGATLVQTLGDNPANAAVWPNYPKLMYSPGKIPVDAKGQFQIEGLIPGKNYTASVGVVQKMNGQMIEMGIGRVFNDVKIEPGKTLDLGDVRVSSEKPKPAAKKTSSTKTSSTRSSQEAGSKETISSAKRGVKVSGRIIGPDGKPAVKASVSLLGTLHPHERGRDVENWEAALAETTTDTNGEYHLHVDAKKYMPTALIASTNGSGIAWRRLTHGENNVEASFALVPQELIRGRLVDIEGKPAGKVSVSILGVMPTAKGEHYNTDGIVYTKTQSAAWPSRVTTDDEGRFVLHGIPAGDGVIIAIEASDRFAPQELNINTGMPEQRTKQDGTYRAQVVKNVKPGEEAVIALAPPQVFEGIVTYEDTGKPAAFAPMSIWASQQKFGSMQSVYGKTDAEGHYRISPLPGIRFGVMAYPPNGVPYLPRRLPEIDWQDSATRKEVNVKLPRGILVRGKVIVSDTGAPVARASVQYIPEEDTNKNATDDIVTGWQATQITNDDGKFEIAVLPGAGRLLVHGPQGEYVLQESTTSDLSAGKKGGQRVYAHAIKRLDVKPNPEPIDVELKLQQAAKITGRLVDEQGQSVDHAIVISQLTNFLTELQWRGDGSTEAVGGQFELKGVAPQQRYVVYFIDPKQRIGATATLKTEDATPTVVLKPCGQATARFVDGEGQPRAGYRASLRMVVTAGVGAYDYKSMRRGEIAADSDFVSNIDRLNHWNLPPTDRDGHITFPALIPGATYHVEGYQKELLTIAKEFKVDSKQTLDLGEIVVEGQD